MTCSIEIYVNIYRYLVFNYILPANVLQGRKWKPIHFHFLPQLTAHGHNTDGQAEGC